MSNTTPSTPDLQKRTGESPAAADAGKTDVAVKIEQIKGIIREELEKSKNTYLLLNRLGVLLSEKQLGSWKNCNEKVYVSKMYEWAEAYFSQDYTVRKLDTGDWCLEPRGEDAAEPTLYPMQLDPANEGAKAELSELYQAITIPDINAMCDLLRRNSGYTGVFSSIWLAYLGRCWTLAKQERRGRRFIGTDPESGKSYLAIKLENMTFRPAKASGKGQQLYLLCEQTDEKWILTETVCGYSGTFGPGKIFRDILGIGGTRGSSHQFQHLQKLSEELTAAYNDQALKDALRQAAECLENGTVYTDKDGIGEKLKTLSDLWTKAFSFNGYYELSLSAEKGSLQDIQTAVRKADNPCIRYEDHKRELARQLSELVGCSAVKERADQISADVDALTTGQGDIGPILDKYLLLQQFTACEGREQWKLAEGVAVRFPGEDPFGFAAQVRGEGEHREKLSAIADFIEKIIRPELEAMSQADEPVPEEKQERETLLSVDRSIPIEIIRTIVSRRSTGFNLPSPDNRSEEQDALTQINSRIGAPNDFETLLIREKTEAARAMAESGLKGYSEDDVTHILGNLSNLERLTKGMTYLYTGNRLYEVQGNLNNRAESYWLAALQENNTIAAGRLLDLYRSERRNEEFRLIYEAVEELEKSKSDWSSHILRLYSSAEEYENVLDVFRKYPEVIYYDTNLDTVMLAASECGEEEIVEYCFHVSRAYAQVEANALDECIIDNDFKFISGLVQADESTIREKGYDPAELERVYDCMSEGSLPDGADDYSIAQRFWSALGNTRSQAEYYAWKSLTLNRVSEQAAKLIFPILSSDKTKDRSVEIIRFYQSKAYNSQLEKSEVCRIYYLNALCRRAETEESVEAAAAVMEFVRFHLRDVVRTGCCELAIACCKAVDAPAVADMMATLQEMAETPFYHALITGSSALCEYETDAEELVALGFDAQQIEQITLQLKQSFPKGQSAGNLAFHLYQTIGWYGGWAARFAEHESKLCEVFGLKATDELLNLKIQYNRHMENWEQLYALFAANPKCCTSHAEIYAQTLFHTEQYEEYWAAREQLSTLLPPEGGAFHRIAAARMEPWSDERCLQELAIPASYIAAHPSSMLSLGQWLWETGRTEAWKGLVPRWFGSALTEYTPEQLEDLLSCGRKVPADTLRGYQAQWLTSRATTAAAIFVWRYLDGGECARQAEEFCEQELKSEINLREGGSGLKALELLFPEQKDELQLQRAFHKLNAIRPDVNDTESVELIASQLRREDLPLEKQQHLSDLVRRLNHVPAQLIPGIAGFWGRMAQGGEAELTAQDYSDMRTFLTANCSRPVDITVAGSLAKIYKKEGSVSLSVLAEHYWENNGEVKLSLLALIRETDPGELEQFFAQAGLFVRVLEGDEERVQLLQSSEGEDAAAAIEAALRMFCVNPPPYGVARYLPLQENPERRLEVLALAARETADWEDCVDYAVETGQNGKLPGIFLRWLKSCDGFFGVSAVLTRLEGLDLPSGEESDHTAFRELFACICTKLGKTQSTRTLRQLSEFVLRYNVAALLLNGQEPYRSVCESYFRPDAVSELCLLLCRMLLALRVGEAKTLLKLALEHSVELISSTIRLNNRYYASTETMRNTFHTEFFAPMADMEEQELLQYVQTPWVNRLLNLIKTDGKLPNYNKMLEIWVWPELCSGDEQTLHTSAETLDRMWSFSPQYYALARLLFFVCKQLYARQATHTPNGSDELIRWLYKAEYGICMESGRRGWTSAPHAQANSTYGAQYEDFLQVGVLAGHRGLVDPARIEADIADTAGALRQHSQNGIQSELRREYNRDFASYTGMLREVLKNSSDHLAIQRMVLCRATGSWKEGIRWLYEQNEHMSDYKFWLCVGGGMSGKPRYQTQGVVRGVLQVYAELEESEREKFADWAGLPGTPENRAWAYYDDACMHRDLLDVPLEETVIDVFLHEEKLRAIDADEESYYSKLSARARLMVGIQYSVTFLISLLSKAAFGKNDPDSLKVTYAYETVIPEFDREKAKKDKKTAEGLENSRARACACCILAKISAPKKKFETEEILDAFLLILQDRDPVGDHHIARFLSNLREAWEGKPQNVEKWKWGELYAFLLHLYEKLAKEEIGTIMGSETARDAFLKYVDAEGLNRGHETRYIQLRSRFLEKWENRKNAGGYNLRPYDEILKQIRDYADTNTSQKFLYASDVADRLTIINGEDSDEVKQALKEGTLIERLKAACCLYRCNSQALFERLQVGILEYHYQKSKEDFEKADTVLLNMMEDYAGNRKMVQIPDEESRLYEELEALLDKGLPEMLKRIYILDFETLAEWWRPFRGPLSNLFVKARTKTEDDSLPDDLELICVEVFRFLDQKKAANLKEIRNELEENIQDAELRTQICALLSQSIEKQNAAPKFAIHLSCEHAVRSYEQYGEAYSLFGVVKNTGNRDADNLELTVEFLTPGVTASCTRYVRSGLHLWPNSTAPFRITFDCPEGVDKVECQLTATGTWGAHPLRETTKLSVPIVQSPAHPSVKFAEVDISDMGWEESEEHGVNHPALVGRDDEMKAIREWFEGDFRTWKNGLIYGFRRAGKTTMLRYIKAYLEKKHPKNLRVINCNNTGTTFKEAFINNLLAQVKEIGEGDFKNKWSSVDDESLTDLKLVQFLNELSEMLNSKLLILFDEFDALIKENKPENCNKLDRICQNDMLKERVHFVFCGANTMRHSRINTQFFDRSVTLQQIGKVGSDDLKKFLTRGQNPLEETMEFAGGALDYMYQNGGGFLWFSGKMAESVARTLKREKRKTAYPYDVCKSEVVGDPISMGTVDGMRGDFGNTSKRILLETIAGTMAQSVSLSELARTIGKDLETTHAELEKLFELGYIQKVGDSGYRIANEFFRRVYYKGDEPNWTYNFECWVEKTEMTPQQEFDDLLNQL